MSDAARAEIFARLRGVSRDAGAARIATDRAALGHGPTAALPADDPVEAFLVNVLKNRGTVDCQPNRGEAVQSLRRFLHEHFRSQRFVAGNDPRLAAMPWRDAGLLPRFGALENGEPVAMSFAQLGVAELGAVVTVTGKGNPAANNLLGEQHIVLVDVTDVVPDMETAWQRLAPLLAPGQRPRGINFIAGPSSTADIEGQLVQGAHGPRGWHVVLLGEVPDCALDRAHEIAGV